MSSSASAFDPTEFRKALGAFATGVTIITTRTADGTPLGLTANSFNSVSLNPPLVLWSLANTSMSIETFKTAPHWAVHVLASDQEALSGRFARRGEDKFSGLDVDTGVGGIPLLRGCTARFQCKTAFQYEGGDHVIFVGEVVSFDRADSSPLVFHGGKYAHAAHRDPNARPRSAYLSGGFSEDFLGYLLGRGHFQFFGRVRPLLAAENLSDEEFYILSALTLKEVVTASQMRDGLSLVLDENGSGAIEALILRGLVRNVFDINGQPAYQLTADGTACALRVIAAGKAVETQMLAGLSAGDAAALKSLLNKLLKTIDQSANALWHPINN
jgi:3-hydroxy-9,10-secoandrosta-1,3,5(10)-triene-9,17-dione monooxygenase reductase component